MKIIGHIRTDFPDKFGIPRQSGLVAELNGRIVFEKEFRDPSALRGLAEFSHIWVLWEFSRSKSVKWSPTVRPPLLGGNKRIGVFATRSPFRPNAIGLSALRLERIEKTENDGYVLCVSGCDMADNTPIFDIKPYLAYTDSIPGAKGGFTEALEERRLTVELDDELLSIVPKEKQQTLLAVLEGDPRPSYHNDEKRIYGFEFAGFEIKFRVRDAILTVEEIKKTKKLLKK